jgi:hypothetical protein
LLTLKWRRVAPRWVAMVLTAGIAVLGVVFTLAIVTEVVKSMADGGPGFQAGQLVAILLVLAVSAASVQLYRMDLYVSEQGVRQRGFRRTRTWSWPEIQEFRLKPMAGLKVLGGYAIWIRLTDGSEIETPVHYAESLPAMRGLFMTDYATQETLTLLQGALTRSRTAAKQPR